jgi:hypothetical protein
MRALPRLSFVLIAAVLILACGIPTFAIPALKTSPTTAPAATSTPVIAPPTSPNGPTPTHAVPIGTSAPQPADTATAAPGTQVSYGNVSFTIPSGLGSGTVNTTSTEVEFPYMNPSNGDMPQHVRMVINSYPILGTSLQPQVMTFPAADYAQYAPLTQEVISALQGMQFMDGQPLPAGFPDGPFSAHVGALPFAGGSGIRYLTQFDQAPLPVNNQELIYYFHGLTSDGKTYVEVILPVQAAFLAPDNNPASDLPQDGIPFNMDNIGPYFQAVSDKLNATPPGGFTPSIDTLDALVQSISVK